MTIEEANAKIAEKVMGWHREEIDHGRSMCLELRLTSPSGNQFSATCFRDDYGHPRLIKKARQEAEAKLAANIPDYCRSTEASKQLRENLAETAHSVIIEWMSDIRLWYCQIWPSEESNTNFYAEGKDVELAVALCALKSVGLDATIDNAWRSDDFR